MKACTIHNVLHPEISGVFRLSSIKKEYAPAFMGLRIQPRPGNKTVKNCRNDQRSDASLVMKLKKKTRPLHICTPAEEIKAATKRCVHIYVSQVTDRSILI